MRMNMTSPIDKTAFSKEQKAVNQAPIPYNQVIMRQLCACLPCGEQSCFFTDRRCIWIPSSSPSCGLPLASCRAAFFRFPRTHSTPSLKSQSPLFPLSLMPLNNLVDGLWWALWKGIIDAVTFAKWPVTSCEWVSAAGASLSSCCPPRRASFRNLLFSSPPAGQEYVKGEHENTRKRGRFYARIRLIKAKLTFLDSFPRMLLEL
jgi:hypothetical protein